MNVTAPTTARAFAAAASAPVAPAATTAGVAFAHAKLEVERARDGVLARQFDQLPTIDAAIAHVVEGFALLAPDASLDPARKQAQAAIRELQGARYHVDSLDRGTTDVALHQHLAVEWLGVARSYLVEIAATLA
ncbi:MAG: hypothetical protein JWN72_5 [Thermoleophilia bacterium]|nr:hypothetical protein [Thermoleophilia bacterium]